MVGLTLNEATASESRQTGRILAVGVPEDWKQKHRPQIDAGNVVYVAFQDVDNLLLDRLQPDAVVSPALAWEFDCIDLAVLLDGLSFNGMYRATALELPKPEVVESEISQLCPNLDFGIITAY